MRLVLLLLLAFMLLEPTPVFAQEQGPTESQEEAIFEAPPQSETYESPFQDKPDVSADNKLMQLYVGPKNVENQAADTRQLSVPHRTDEQLRAWLMDVIPQTLTYTNSTMNKDYGVNSKLFTPSGLTVYRDYLSKSGLLYEMQTKKLRMATVATQKPQLLNEGVANDLYKWLYDVYVMVSLMPEDVAGMPRFDKSVSSSREIVIRLQLTRINSFDAGASVKDGAIGVMIETWDVRDYAAGSQ